MFTSKDYKFTLELQLYLCAEATLGTEENGHCREVAVAGGSTVHRIIFTCHFYLHFSSDLHRKQ